MGFRTSFQKLELSHFNPHAQTILRTSSIENNRLANCSNAYITRAASGCFGTMDFLPSGLVWLEYPRGALFGCLPPCLARRFPFVVFNALRLFSATGLDRYTASLT